MSTVRKRAAENIEEILGALVLGAGFIALFAGFNYFFLIWILGFVMLIPIVSALLGDEDESNWNWWDEDWWNDDWWGDSTNDEHHSEESATETSTTDALQTLRDRYARGELTDDQFERKLDRLFETETPESAAEWRTREREREPVEE